MNISLKTRRIFLIITILWVVGLLFIPMRRDVISGHYTGNSPETQKFVPAHEEHVTALLSEGGFNGGPGAVGGLLFFALFPFFIVWESFNFKRPFSLPGKAFLQLEALLLFLGGPYCYYMITYQQGNFYDTVHITSLAWGGWLLVLQNVLVAALLFIAVANQKGKFAKFFGERE
jgi:hypothetical protein